MEQNQEVKQLKIGFFKRFKMSIINIEQYHFLAAEGPKRAIGYLAILMFIFATVFSIAINIKIDNKIKEAVEFTKDNVPYFEIINNKFHIESEDPLVYEKDHYKVTIDNDPNYNKYIEDISNYNGTYLLINQNNVILKLDIGSPIALSYDNITKVINTEDINKETLLTFYNENKMKIYILLFVYILLEVYIIYIISTLIDALALSLIGILTEKFSGLYLKYGATLSMAVSAMTLSTVLNLVYLAIRTFTGFYIKNFQILYTIISYIYMVMAILIMRSSILKGKLSVKLDEKEESNNLKGDES